MMLSEAGKNTLREVFVHLSAHNSFPLVQAFRRRFESQRKVIDQLVADALLRVQADRYELTLRGLRFCPPDLAAVQLRHCDALLWVLQDAYRQDQNREWGVEDLAKQAREEPIDVAKDLTFLVELPYWRSYSRSGESGLVTSVQLTEAILDAEPLELLTDELQEPATPEDGSAPLIHSLKISGYRPFSGFHANPKRLTIIVGANASGKSSLFDFLRFLAYAAVNPLPPEIDPFSVGKTLFHVGGPERISVEIVVDLRQRMPLRYEVEIQGPVGMPRISRERLATVEPLSTEAKSPFLFLDFEGGKGVVRDQIERRLKRPQWSLLPNELALRRALDPTLVTLSRFQAYVSSWRFYSGFNVSAGAAVRRPVPTEPKPTLAEDGANLSAVLFSLVSEHQPIWQELEVQMRAAVPGFESLTVVPRGGPGTVIATWRERSIPKELTLADLSDGTLRLLCWATLCLAPALPPLICIDEPELGLHPRVLPILAGLLRNAATRTQVFVATHSPYLLAQFALDDIAVMRKEKGKAQFIRPDSSSALRREVAEMGGEALAQLHISDELETRP